MDFLSKIWEDIKQHPIIATALAAAAVKVGLRNGRRIGRLASNYKAMKNAPVSYGVVASDVSPVYGKINGGSSNSGILRTVEDLDAAKAEAAAYPGAEVVQYIEKPNANMTTAIPARIFGNPEYVYSAGELPFRWDPNNKQIALVTGDNLSVDNVADRLTLMPLSVYGYNYPEQFGLSGEDPIYVNNDVTFLKDVAGSDLMAGVVIPDINPYYGHRYPFYDDAHSVTERLYNSPKAVWTAPLGQSTWKTALGTVPKFNWMRDVLAPVVWGGLGAGAAGLGYGAYKLYDYLTGK